MIPSNWSRATKPPEDAPLLAVPTKRGCADCALAADLIHVSVNGIALYVCPDGHHSFVGVSKPTRAAEMSARTS